MVDVSDWGLCAPWIADLSFDYCTGEYQGIVRYGHAVVIDMMIWSGKI